MVEGGLHVIDVDAIIDGSARRMVEEGRITGRLLIHRIIIEYLYHEASKGLSHGFTGLSELNRLLALSSDNVEIIIVDDERTTL